MSDNLTKTNLDQIPVISLKTILFISLAIIAGSIFAAVVLPLWLPNFVQSIFGPNVQVFWFLSRGSAVVAYCLLWLSMVLGLLMTNRFARVWPGAPTANELHNFISLLGLGFVLFHVLILLGDSYIKYNLFQLFVPFASVNYKSLYVGFGQIGVYLWLMLMISFYIRRKIGNHAWRLLHFAGFIAFIFAMLHGLLSGTDSGTVWMQSIYRISASSLVFLTAYRILNSTVKVLIGKQKTVRG